MSGQRLTEVQRWALERLHPLRWRGTLEVGVMGSTLMALEGKGLVRVVYTNQPHRRLVGRLTADGVQRRLELHLDRLGEQDVGTLTAPELVTLWTHDRITGDELDDALARLARAANARHAAELLRVHLLGTLEAAGPDGLDADYLARYLDADLDEVENEVRNLHLSGSIQPHDGGWRASFYVQETTERTP